LTLQRLLCNVIYEMRTRTILIVFSAVFFSFCLAVYGEGETPSRDSPSGVWVIPVRGDIDRGMVVFLRRGIERAVREGAEFLIFDINTFGGRVDSALQITTLIGSVDEAETIAYITTTPESLGVSWSAGALISFACSRIFMAPGTSIGAAAPVYMTQEGPQSAGEKTVSAVRAQIAALAEKNGYPVNIARAMVDTDIEIREVRVGGEIRVLTEDEIEGLERGGENPERGRIVSQKGKLLTLTAKEMERYKVSSGTVADTEKLLESLGIGGGQAVTVEKTVADRAVGIITGSAVTSLLIVMGLIALFLEITSPGFGVPGTVAIVCFAVVFASYALLGTVGSLELILFVIGLVLLIVEVFLIPGFGVVGISGLILIVLSLILSMQGFVWPQYNWQWAIFRRNILVVVSSAVGSIAVFALLASLLPQVSLFSRLTLQTEQTADAGYTVQELGAEARLLGKRGKAVTTLRPSGKAEFESEVLSVETDGEFLSAGDSVQIIEVNGNRIVVRKC
jgi:membrane-bound serine protease (ClpP class)